MVQVVSMKRQPVQPAGVPTFIGIDYHKAYSVYCVLDAQGSNLERGRIDHARPEDFRALVRRSRSFPRKACFPAQ